MRFVTLQKMFIDAQEVKENLRAFGKFSDQVKDEEWNVSIADSEHEQERCLEEELAEKSVAEQDVVYNFVNYDIQEAFFLFVVITEISSANGHKNPSSPNTY
jgi:hypothetical protein